MMAAVCGTTVLYTYQRNDMEFPTNTPIPKAAARRAVHEFAPGR